MICSSTPVYGQSASDARSRMSAAILNLQRDRGFRKGARMERLTQKAPDSEMVWFKDKERLFEPCEMSAHQSRLAIAKLAAYEQAEDQGLLLRLPISKDTPVYSIEYCCGRNKNNRIGMCVRGFCKDCDDKAYYIREDTAEHCSICEIQKSVFFTPGEAEAKLKEMEGAE